MQGLELKNEDQEITEGGKRSGQTSKFSNKLQDSVPLPCDKFSVQIKLKNYFSLEVAVTVGGDVSIRHGLELEVFDV